ncbi:hypothetical protein HM1_2886 [Heliomicrobium modesticaldum Ice1]|uniref:Uncharacterized protein n=1 Tax=Heliobacterium modesticaldum (strain ATCC 51547 / Ice1) TaxID=498761 RepID=B0TCU4_HELMI|nr:hypothetical protein HM1_2886 [Heliomicrobium modesticaldum Ice1]
MNSCTAVGEAARLAEHPDQLLQGFNVPAVGQYRAYQLHTIFPACLDNPAALLFLSPDAAVAHELPYPSVRCDYFLRVVIIVSAFDPPAQKLRGDLCRLRPCNPCKFNLDSKSRFKHCAFLLAFLCFLPFGSVH